MAPLLDGHLETLEKDPGFLKIKIVLYREQSIAFNLSVLLYVPTTTF